MNEDEYLAERLDDQITWYDEKSQTNQKWFKRLKLLEIIAATIIPFWAGIGTAIPYYSIFIGALGVVIAVSAGVSAIYRFHENWIEYRTTAEQLKHEKFIYLTNIKPYDTQEKFELLVERVEALISRENSAWATTTKKLSNAGKRHN